MFVARRIRPISVTREAAGALKRGPPPHVWGWCTAAIYHAARAVSPG
jgi:hypothetical protein